MYFIHLKMDWLIGLKTWYQFNLDFFLPLIFFFNLFSKKLWWDLNLAGEILILNAWNSIRMLLSYYFFLDDMYWPPVKEVASCPTDTGLDGNRRFNLLSYPSMKGILIGLKIAKTNGSLNFTLMLISNIGRPLTQNQEMCWVSFWSLE